MFETESSQLQYADFGRNTCSAAPTKEDGVHPLRSFREWHLVQLQLLCYVDPWPLISQLRTHRTCLIKKNPALQWRLLGAVASLRDSS